LASIINASNSGFGGIVSTGDSSGQLQLQAAGTTVATIQSTGLNLGSNGVVFSDSSSQTAAASPYVLKNRIINGDMEIAQRGTSATISTASAVGFGADRFFTDSYNWTAGSNITVSNETTVVPSGYSNSYKWANGATPLTLGAGGFQSITQKIEGYNIYDLYTGNITISFWVRASTAGTYTLWIANSYVNSDIYITKQYTISSANTWEQKSITVDLSGGIAAGGTWNKTNGEGLAVSWMLGANANRTGNTALNTWVNGPSVGLYQWQTSASVQLSSIANSTFYLTGVQLEAGTTATPFERRLYNQELANCQRYYYLHANGDQKVIALGSYYDAASIDVAVPYKVSMRTTPTVVQTTGTNYYQINRNSGGDAFNSFSIADRITTETIQITANANISGTAGQVGLVVTNNASASLAFSAEL
jgi:hypothetical protein